MERKTKVIIFGLIVFCLNSCGLFFYNYYWTEEGGRRPTSSQYKLAKPTPYKLQVKDPIDTNAIYISHTEFSVTGGNKYKQYTGVRFFSDGRCFYITNEFKDRLSVKSFNNINGVRNPGYYRIENSNEIRIENFGMLKYSDEIRWAKYTNYRGYFKGDSLILFTELKKNKPFPELRYKDGFTTNAEVYVPYKAEGLKGKADW